MVVTGYLAGKVEPAITGRMNDISEKGAELPRCEVCKCTHGVWAAVPVECVVVERLLLKIFHCHSVQRG
jgi:hypothetical protein